MLAGQGTIAVELLEQIPQLDAVFVAVGGGGLIGGIGAYLKYASPKTEVVGCWPENSPVLYESMKAGWILPVEEKSTLSESTAGGLEEAIIPPVGHMEFEEPPGDCHIKYGHLKGGETFTVKIATGFWKNPEQGLPSSNGVVLVFSSRTGELLTILQDEGYLTDIRTAAAGAVAAKYLAPSAVECIGIVGAGTVYPSGLL